jgi:hypothetical protein
MQLFSSRRPVDAESQERVSEIERVSARTAFKSPTGRLAGPGRRRQVAVAVAAATLIMLLAVASLSPTLFGVSAPSAAAPGVGEAPQASAIAIASDVATQEAPTGFATDTASPAPDESSAAWTLEPYPSRNDGPRAGDPAADFYMFVGLDGTGGMAWGDRARVGVNAPAGATCSVQLKFPTGVILDLGTHTVSGAEAKSYYWIWFTVPESGGRGWVMGKARCVLGNKQAGGDWGYFFFGIDGGAHKPQGWWIQLDYDGFSVVAGNRGSVSAWVVGPMPDGDNNTCSALIHLPGGLDVPIATWKSGVDTRLQWFDVPADTPAGPGTYDVTCSSPNETKVVHGHFTVGRLDPTPEPTAAPSAGPTHEAPTPLPTASLPPTATPALPTDDPSATD